MAVKRDVNPRNMTFPKVEKVGGLIGRGINTDNYGTLCLCPYVYILVYTFLHI